MKEVQTLAGQKTSSVTLDLYTAIASDAPSRLAARLDARRQRLCGTDVARDEQDAPLRWRRHRQ